MGKIGGTEANQHQELTIQMRGVTRAYRVGDSIVRAIDRIDLDIRRGEFVAVMGPSGSGKSTLLNVIGCLDRPTSGTYILDGEDVAHLSEDRLAEVRQRKVSFVFQSFHLVGRMTAVRNVELPMIFSGVPPRERRKRVEAALEAVGLTPRARHRPDQLSGGERQRVAIARAMVMQPQVLLADEPTGNLDTEAGNEIVRLLAQMHAGGLTIVLVTHNHGIAAHAERVIRMRDGRLLDGGKAAQEEAPGGSKSG